MNLKTPQLENGYTRIANELLEAFCRLTLSPYEARILFAVIRKTYGYGKKHDRLPLSQLFLLTGIQKSHISRTIHSLLQRSIVTSHGNSIGINKDITMWQNPLPRTVKLPATVNAVTSHGNKKLPPEAPQKKERNYTKDNCMTIIKEKNLDELSSKRCLEFYGSCEEMGLDARIPPDLYIATLYEFEPKVQTGVEIRECLFWAKTYGHKTITISLLRKFFRNRKKWNKEQELKNMTREYDKHERDPYKRPDYKPPIDVDLTI